MNNLRLVTNYSNKSFALVAPYDCYFKEELQLIGGRYNTRLACGGGWIFSTAKHLECIEALLSAYEIEYTPTELTDDERAIIDAKRQEHKNTTGGTKPTGTPDYILNDKKRRAWVETFATDRKWDDVEYWLKNFPIACRLENGEIVPIHASKLETEFWHHDEGSGLEVHNEITSTKDKMREYFLCENLEKISDIIDGLQGKRTGTSYEYLWLGNWHDDRNSWELQWSNIHPESINAADFLDWSERKMYNNGKYRKLSANDKERLLVAYKLAYDRRKKRCETWLKRYGVEKLSFKTYWADR